MKCHLAARDLITNVLSSMSGDLDYQILSQIHRARHDRSPPYRRSLFIPKCTLFDVYRLGEQTYLALPPSACAESPKNLVSHAFI